MITTRAPLAPLLRRLTLGGHAVAVSRAAVAAHAPLGALLVAATALRLILALRGGQGYWPDEERGWRTFRGVDGVVGGDLLDPLQTILFETNHVGFAFADLPISLLLYPPFRLAGLSLDDLAPYHAALLSLYSAASVALIYGIARRAGGSRVEALAAATLMACSASMLYFTRHILSYDASLCLLLLALWLGLRPRPPLGHSALVGLVIGFGFMTYYGYWGVALIVGVVHLTRARVSRGGLLARGVVAGVGVLSLPALLTIASSLLGERLFFWQMHRQAIQILQGDLEGGWWVVVEYLWQAEHGLLVLWLLSLPVLGALVARGRGAQRERALLWLGCAVAAYALLALTSTGLHLFAVYGRLARQTVPFLCLASGCAVAALAARWPLPRLAAPALGLGLAAHTAFSFSTPLLQRFPDEVRAFAEERYGRLDEDATLQGEPVETHRKRRKYVLLNARHLTSFVGPKDPPAGEVVFQTPHPLQYPPYQYEGLTAENRALVRATDISMRVIRRAKRGGAGA